MKILFFVQSLEGGGAERVVCNLSNYLVDRGHQVAILTMYDHGVAYKLDESVKVVCANVPQHLYRTKWKDIKIAIGLFRKFDVCVSFLSTPILLSLILKPLFKAKIICTERNYPPVRYGEKLQQRLKRYAKKADAWVFQTKNQRDWYGDSVADSKAYIIPNAINTDFLLERGMPTERKKEIVTVGSLQEKKDHQLLIHAFSKISDKYSDYKLVIYGEGELRNELTSLISELKMENHIELPGFVENIPEKIRTATLFVMSSKVEGIPNALIEAMALGVPCISTRCAGGGAESLIIDGKNGLLTSVGDIEALSVAIKRLLSDEDMREKLGEKAKEITIRLSPEKIYDQWESVIKSL